MSNRKSAHCSSHHNLTHRSIIISNALLNNGMTPRTGLLLLSFSRLSSAFISPSSSSIGILSSISQSTRSATISSISRRALSSTTTLTMSKQNSNSNELNIHWFRQNDIR